jgi:hypothetical protein
VIQPISSPRLAAVAAFALAAAGCGYLDPPPADDDDGFRHRAYTAWQPLPSKDGSRLAFALEPRRVDAEGHGVMIHGWHGKVAGDGVVRIATDADQPVVATVPRGFLDSDLDDETLFVWTKAASTWTPTAPNDMPPPAPYASVTWLDRATFAVKGTRSFDPPLEVPIAVGGGRVLETPRRGASDFERDVRIVLHEPATGAAEPLHADRGFAVATCTRGSAVTVAYQRGTDKTTIVDVVVESGRGHVARVDLDDFLADAVECRAGGQHVAVIGGKPSTKEGRALVFARAADALDLFFQSSLGVPAVLSKDGTRLLAAGPDGGGMLVTKNGARPLAGVRMTTRARLLVSGDRAVVLGDRSSTLVRLDGTQPSVSEIPVPPADREQKAFATGDGTFLFFETTYDAARYDDVVARAFVVDAAGAATDIAFGEYRDPSLAWADGRRAWLLGDREGEGVDLVAIDLGAKTVASIVPFPLCDRAAMQTKDRCLP